VTLQPPRHEDTKDLIEDLSPYASLPVETEQIAKEIVDSAYKVHKALGPGLIESVYEVCLGYELRKRKIPFQTQPPVPIVYDGVRLETALRLDLLVADSIIVELKAVDQMNPVFEAQLLSYLKLTGHRLGFLINFNVALIKDGIQRIII
jgi:GxxExxY protein